MKCPFCAEDIKDEAVLCRFCGAHLSDGAWRPPASARGAAPKRNMTILTSGVLLMVTAAWSFAMIADPVALFGAMRGGAVAYVYNALYGAALGALGLALATRRAWAMKAVLVATVVYTLDKLEFIVDAGARKAALKDVGGGMLEGMGPMVDQGTVALSATFLVGWWAFAGYLFLRRGYFSDDDEEPAPRA